MSRCIPTIEQTLHQIGEEIVCHINTKSCKDCHFELWKKKLLTLAMEHCCLFLCGDGGKDELQTQLSDEFTIYWIK